MKRNILLLSPDAGESAGDTTNPAGGPPDVTSPAQQRSQDKTAKRLKELEAENAELRSENARLGRPRPNDKRVQDRVAAGLTREQAENVVKQQDEHDKWLAKREEEQAEAREKARK